MGRKRNPIWSHFVAFDPPTAKGKHYRAKCNYCSHELTGQAVRLINHLHNCPQKPADLIIPAAKGLDRIDLLLINSKQVPHHYVIDTNKYTSDSARDRKGSSSSSSSASSCDISSLPLCSPTSVEMKKAINSMGSSIHIVDSDQLDELIAKAFCSANIPMQVIEHPAIVDLFRFLTPMDYDVPSKDLLLRKHLESKRQIVTSTSEIKINGRKPKILLAASGSVAVVKVPELALKLSNFAEVRIVVTKSADFFLPKAAAYDKNSWDIFKSFQPDQIPIFREEQEWKSWKEVGDPVTHINLREWADLLLFAPLSANTMAKLANGLCDNLATCVARAWDIINKPVLFAPAMNTQMWKHPCTERQLSTLQNEYKYILIPPVAKTLACGDIGNGALAKVEDIVDCVIIELAKLSAKT